MSTVSVVAPGAPLVRTVWIGHLTASGMGDTYREAGSRTIHGDPATRDGHSYRLERPNLAYALSVRVLRNNGPLLGRLGPLRTPISGPLTFGTSGKGRGGTLPEICSRPPPHGLVRSFWSSPCARGLFRLLENSLRTQKVFLGIFIMGNASS